MGANKAALTASHQRWREERDKRQQVAASAFSALNWWERTNSWIGRTTAHVLFSLNLFEWIMLFPGFRPLRKLSRWTFRKFNKPARRSKTEKAYDDWRLECMLGSGVKRAPSEMAALMGMTVIELRESLERVSERRKVDAKRTQELRAAKVVRYVPTKTTPIPYVNARGERQLVKLFRWERKQIESFPFVRYPFQTWPVDVAGEDVPVVFHREIMWDDLSKVLNAPPVEMAETETQDEKPKDSELIEA